ncbi:MAG: hypothetical protein WAW46_02435 [Polaromonas sp.]
MEVDLTKHKVPEAGRGTCFLCGKEMDAADLGQEHVFAKWLQRRFALWDRELVLLNGTRIPYRNLKIPACAPCNNISLSDVENKVARALSGGAKEVRSLGHEILYLWLAKLFFGILYAESLLPMNRAAQNEGPILGSATLEGFRFMHFMMQAARTKMIFSSQETHFHSSVLVFPLQEHPDSTKHFMYRDDIENGCIAVRLNSVGLICATDGGAQERLAEEVFPKLFQHVLHPLQFEEVTAKVFMKARSMTRTAKYISAHSKDETRIIQMPLGGLSEKPIFKDYDHELYAHMLAAFTEHPLELIWPGDGSVQTWIRSYDEPHFIDIRQHPWP